MNILYIVARPLEINTSSSIRNRATIKGLIELDNKVHLITTQYDSNHQSFDNDAKNNMPLNNFETTYITLGGVQNVLKVGRKIKIPKFFKKIISKYYFKFINRHEIYDTFKAMATKIKELELNLNNYDLIITSSDPKSSHLVGLELLKNHKEIPWIQIWGDPFLNDITFKKKRIAAQVKKEEKRLLSLASKVIYVSALTNEMQKVVYPNFANKMNYVPSPYFEEINYQYNIKDKKSFTYLYCGDYFKEVRDIMPLYQAFRNSDNKLIICGNTDLNLKTLNNIHIYPRVNQKQVKIFENDCDILVHISNLKGSQIPGKIYQYSGTNKPIMFILDGDKEEIQNAFQSFNRYMFCDNNLHSIESVISNSIDWIHKLENKPIPNFSPKVVANKILDTLLDK